MALPIQGARGDAKAGQEMLGPIPVANSLCQHVSLLFSCPGTPVTGIAHCKPFLGSVPPVAGE